MIKGAIASLVTPFSADGGLDSDTLSGFSNRMATAGFDVICFAGGTGEFLSLREEERSTGLKAVIEGAEGKPVLASALFTDPNEILRAAEQFAIIGAAAIMVMPPYFYAASQDAIRTHLLNVAEKSALPVLLFNSAGRSGKTMSVDTILALATACPNIVGVKETTENMDDIGRLVAGAPSDFTIIQAHEPVILPSYAMGATGSFGSLCNLVPLTVVRLHRALDAQDLEQARKITLHLSEIARIAYSVTIPVGIKHIMNAMHLYDGGVRQPLSMSSLEHSSKQMLEMLIPKIARLEEASGAWFPLDSH